MRLFITILFLVTIGIQGECQQLRFKALSTNHGLSQGTVWKIHQDQSGFIWIGTDDGLNLYDGYNFKTFKFNPNKEGSISDNSIYDLAEDSKGNIWIATAYGLNKYDPITGNFQLFIKDTANTNCILDNQLRCVEYDEKRNLLWIGTDLGNVIYFDLNTGTKEKTNPIWLNNNDAGLSKIKSLFVDKDGMVWVGTNGLGLFKYDPENKYYEPYTQWSENKKRSLLKNKVTCIFEDNDDFIWIGTDGGHISKINKKTKEAHDYGANKSIKDLRRKGVIRDIVQEDNGTIWVATYHGLIKYNDDDNAFEEYITKNEDDMYSLSSNRLLHLMFDKSGSLWVSNYEKGIDILNNTTPWFGFLNKNEGSTLSLSNNFALAFCEDNHHNIYIGTYDGLNYFNRKKNTVTKIENPNIKKGILSMCYTSDESIWLGTWGSGLVEYNARKNTTKVYKKDDTENGISNNNVLCIYQDPLNSNILWLGTFDGLNKFNKETKKFEVIDKTNGLESNVIFTINGNADTLWIGTQNGGFSELITSSNSITNYLFDKSDPLSLSHNIVLHILDAGPYLYISTKRGLNRFNKEKKTFKVFDEESGLPNANIWATLADEDGRFWITTNGGLSLFNPNESNKKNQFRNFSMIDGIQGSEFNQGGYYYSEHSNEMFFGGVNGVNFFNPKTIKANTYIPPVRINSFKLFDDEAELDTQIYIIKNIELPYNKNFLSFEFSSLDYSAPINNLYSFKMDGLDKNWSSPNNRRFASYPDLKAGAYIFRVKASNSQGLWNETGTAIRIVITPPFWKTPWFVSSALILIIIGIILFIKQREKNLIVEKKILEDTVAQRTLELQKKNHDITSSIQYAKRIQQSIIQPNITDFSETFEESLVLFKPKDIVSGDFFWYTKIEDLHIYAVADCTGHGVPGAFMSIIGNNLLDKIVNEAKITEPDQILNRLKTDLVKSLNQGGGRDDTRDGMDIAIISNKSGSNQVKFAGAYRPLIRISKGELIKYQSDKISIGGLSKMNELFNCQTIDLEPGDCIYAFSDGYPDQFGGPKNKKFLLKRLNNLLLSMHEKSMIEQDIMLEEAIMEWMGKYSQIDDILVVGLKLK